MAKSITDYLGNEFPSLTEFCKFHNICPGTYLYRIHIGMSQEEALKYDKLPNTKTRNAKKIKDHLGNEFESVEKLCDYYNIKYNTYYRRVNFGWDLEKILTKKAKYTRHK